MSQAHTATFVDNVERKQTGETFRRMITAVTNAEAKDSQRDQKATSRDMRTTDDHVNQTIPEIPTNHMV